MSCLAIRVEGIGKQFHYGAYKPTYSFRDFAVATGRQLLRTFRRMRETTLRHEDREAFWACGISLSMYGRATSWQSSAAMEPGKVRS